MKRFLAVMLVVLGSVTARAAEAPSPLFVFRDNVLSGVALNASAATRTITANMYENAGRPIAAYSKARLGIYYTYSAATTVTVLFSCSTDGTNYAQVMARNVSGATATMSKLTDSWTTGAASATDPGLGPEYDVTGCVKAKWVLGGASADGSDLVTVDLLLTAGN